jgi:putative oxidoreductase
VLTRVLGTNGDWVITIVRIVLGVVFFAHGAQMALGWFGGAEFLGGYGLMIGLQSRVAALGIAMVMLAALLAVHRKFGFFMNWFGEKQGHGIEYHILVPALALVVMTMGAGAFSLDHVLYQHVSAQNTVSSPGRYHKDRLSNERNIVWKGHTRCGLTQEIELS